MTHALPDADLDSPAAEPLLGEPDQPPVEPSRSAGLTPGARQVLAELLAEQLTGLAVAHGDLVLLTSVVTAEGTIVVDVVRPKVLDDDVSVRLALELSLLPAGEPEPETEAPAAEDAGVNLFEPHQSEAVKDGLR